MEGLWTAKPCEKQDWSCRSVSEPGRGFRPGFSVLGVLGERLFAVLEPGCPHRKMNVGYTKTYLQGITPGIPSANIAFLTSVVEPRLTVDSIGDVAGP